LARRLHHVTVMLGHRDTIEEITLRVGNAELRARLGVPLGPIGLAILAHAGGSHGRSSRDRQLADALRARGIATLFVELLTEAEEQEDRIDERVRFDVGLLAERLLAITDRVQDHPSVSHLPLAYFGVSTAAAAALIAASHRPELVRSVVARSGRADLAGAALPLVRAPTLLVVGAEDPHVLELNREAIDRMTVTTQLAEVPGAKHLFEEPGAMDEVAQLTTEWLIDHYRHEGGPSRDTLHSPESRREAAPWSQRFADRRAAGQRLAGALCHLGDQLVVCGLPRGGVVVADEIARMLDVPLDVWLVRKVGMPIQPDLGMAAIAEGAALVLDPGLVKWSGASGRELRALVHQRAAEIRRRAKAYRGERGAVDVRGRTVVLVEEGIATGNVMMLRATIRGARRRGAARVVVACPVASQEAVAELRREADELVVPYTPAHVIAIAAWYQTFPGVTEDEVLHVLAEARLRDGARERRITA
jgi:predicted phosphoribosyltransferase/dienelactone hydrolase